MTSKRTVGALVGALVFCCVVGGQASATVYNVNIDVGPTNVSGTITTDGTTGTLSEANITAFALVLHENSITHQLFGVASSGSQPPFVLTAFSATTTGLLWDFGAAGQWLDFFAFDAAFALNNAHFVPLCSTGNNYCTSYGLAPNEVFNTSPQSGVVQFASVVAETPLPAALPLFANGIGALGLLAWRRKKKSVALAA